MLPIPTIYSLYHYLARHKSPWFSYRGCILSVVEEDSFLKWATRPKRNEVHPLSHIWRRHFWITYIKSFNFALLNTWSLSFHSPFLRLGMLQVVLIALRSFKWTQKYQRFMQFLGHQFDFEPKWSSNLEGNIPSMKGQDHQLKWELLLLLSLAFWH